MDTDAVLPLDLGAPREVLGRVTPDGSLPQDHTQAILQTTKRVAALLKASGLPFALAGSVAAFAHGLPANFQHDTDFCVRPEEADAAIEALEAGGIAMRRAPEDWLVKGRSGGEEIDLIFELARRPVSGELLERAEARVVDSVWMPVLAPTDRPPPHRAMTKGHQIRWCTPPRERADPLGTQSRRQLQS
ncbi:hypothetical protein ACE1OC_36765 [Streptomyces sp. DSM 116496]|uniref:hypothetical protein n=1 Tax=Streptomyces stoeckheimensis TaxID=3344656 RepID=UPI0038B2DA6B